MGVGIGNEMEDDDDEDLEAELSRLTAGAKQPKKGMPIPDTSHV